jgi:hypothetical protein
MPAGLEGQVTPDLLKMALALLPPLPCERICLVDEGGQIRVLLIEARDQNLFAELSLLDVRDGLHLTIPIETRERGGYSIGCEIVDTYFMGGLDSAATLTVTEIARRKPYRAKERVPADAVANLHIIAAHRVRPGEAMFARVLDVSSSGIGLSTDQELTVGDRLRVETIIESVAISAVATIVATNRLAFGRFRLGCEFRHLPLQTQHQLDALQPDRRREAS